MGVPSTPLNVVDGQGNPQALEQTLLPDGNLAGGAIITDPATGAKASVGRDGAIATDAPNYLALILIELMTLTQVVAAGLDYRDDLDSLRRSIAADSGLT